MKYIMLFFSLSLSLFLMNCSKQTNTPNIGTQTYRVFDSLRTPIAGAKVVLIESDNPYITNPISTFSRVDSGLTNNIGYISFNNLTVGKYYFTSTTAGCQIEFLTAVHKFANISDVIRDTIEISVWPSGYLNIINPLPNYISVMAQTYLFGGTILYPFSAKTIILSRRTDTIRWAKYNPTTQNYEGNIFDTVIPISCGDTSILPFHL